MVQEGLAEKLWVYGNVQNATIHLLVERTTLPQRRFNAIIELKTKNSQVIYSALKPDVDHLEGHTCADIKLANDTIIIDVNSYDLSHLRASLNSYLRLAKTAISCLDTTL